MTPDDASSLIHACDPPHTKAWTTSLKWEGVRPTQRRSRLAPVGSAAPSPGNPPKRVGWAMKDLPAAARCRSDTGARELLARPHAAP